MGDVVIRAEGLSKLYRIDRTRRRAESLRELLAAATRRLADPLARGEGRGREEFWALNDASFEVSRGEILGIVGRNGSGKSTLLKLLSRVARPTRGLATIRGRLGALLEVGTGFHPELTGRENVYLNGAILGMRRAEIDRKFDEIVAFAEVERFLETPVKRYSSGMYVRLAFAVAAHLEPEILIVDEVLAVGDAAFQKRCLGKLKDVAGGGRTVLFVSHNLPVVSSLCTTAMWLDGGVVRHCGEATAVVRAYLTEGRAEPEVDLAPSREADGPGGPMLRSARLLRDGEPDATFECDGPFEMEVRCLADPKRSATLSLGLLVRDEMGEAVFGANMHQYHAAIRGASGEFAFRVRADRLPLAPGTYTISLFLGNGVYDLETLEDMRFEVAWRPREDIADPPRRAWGPIFVPVRWDVTTGRCP